MKKSIISIFFALAGVSAFSQTTTTAPAATQAASAEQPLVSKKGIPILPQEGDFAIGVDAVPYLNYLGNSLNGNTNNTFLNLASSQNIYGKYFLSDESAIRAVFSISSVSNTQTWNVRNDASYKANTLTTDSVQDSKTSNTHAYGLNIAYQKYRGYGRLRGIYGAQAGAYYKTGNASYTYGNDLTLANQLPSTASAIARVDGDKRLISTDAGSTKALNVGGLAGVEYFFAPKMCIGFEVNLSLAYSWSSKPSMNYKRVSGTSIEDVTTPTTTGDSNLSLQTTTYGAWKPVTSVGLYLMFHF